MFIAEYDFVNRIITMKSGNEKITGLQLASDYSRYLVQNSGARAKAPEPFSFSGGDLLPSGADRLTLTFLGNNWIVKPHSDFTHQQTIENLLVNVSNSTQTEIFLPADDACLGITTESLVTLDGVQSNNDSTSVSETQILTGLTSIESLVNQLINNPVWLLSEKDSVLQTLPNILSELNKTKVHAATAALNTANEDGQ